MDGVNISKRGKLGFAIFLWILVIIWLIPFIALIQKTLLGDGANNYLYVITNKINGILLPITYLNSFIIAVLATLFTVVVAALAAFGFSKLEIKFKNMWFNMIVIGLATPAISIIIPLYFVFNKCGILNTRMAVVLTQVILFIPLSTLMLRNFYDSLPKELMEAARIDGANNFQVFTLVYLPIAKPAIANLSILIMTWSFKDFLVPLMFLTSRDKLPATVAISALADEFSSSLTNIGRYNAALALLAVIPFIFFLIGRKYLENGVVSGSVKG